MVWVEEVVYWASAEVAEVVAGLAAVAWMGMAAAMATQTAAEKALRSQSHQRRLNWVL